MDVFPQSIRPVMLLKPRRHDDARGYFSEIYSARALKAQGLSLTFVQDNMSFSAEVGTIRGLHFQAPPSEQTKLVGVLTGAILDVAVDLRRGSPSFGRHVAAELSAENGLQMLVPRGFAHGFCTLLPETRVMYKVDGYYDAQRDFGLRWNDPALDISWPVSESDAKLSPKDRIQPLLSELPASFTYGGDGA